MKIRLRLVKVLLCVLLVRSRSDIMGNKSSIVNWPTENMAGKVDSLKFEP